MIAKTIKIMKNRVNPELCGALFSSQESLTLLANRLFRLILSRSRSKSAPNRTPEQGTRPDRRIGRVG
jgi:hypothetical protein